ncbi:hypothetical protein [Agromyces mariniharenae]|uniref:Uncharacterized protein n=1 Tax=Agromyces mariniharenae TaxID=2604423 RepID=A0A5S4V7R3_9MICO|nr:hypothetical protein [Agromyces mariniharenae]TYL54099.1 hypothetical protein FYC51_10960 [Agromyces mariniharenae]
MARRSKRDERDDGVDEGPGRQQGARFEATVHPGERDVALSQVSDLDLDRIPDPQGGVRVVVTADELAELVRRGYEVRVFRTVPIEPLDPKLIQSDEDAKRWLDERVAGIPREEEG